MRGRDLSESYQDRKTALNEIGSRSGHVVKFVDTTEQRVADIERISATKHDLASLMQRSTSSAGQATAGCRRSNSKHFHTIKRIAIAKHLDHRQENRRGAPRRYSGQESDFNAATVKSASGRTV
jgi:hypothetical protein